MKIDHYPSSQSIPNLEALDDVFLGTLLSTPAAPDEYAHPFILCLARRQATRHRGAGKDNNIPPFDH